MRVWCYETLAMEKPVAGMSLMLKFSWEMLLFETFVGNNS